MYENCIFCFLNKGMKQLFNFNLYSCYPSQQIKNVVIHWWGKEINIKQYVFYSLSVLPDLVGQCLVGRGAIVGYQ